MTKVFGMETLFFGTGVVYARSKVERLLCAINAKAQ
jgi:hypothetical protein